MNKTPSKEEIKIIKKYARFCEFPNCNSWSDVNNCFNELMRINNALERNLPITASWRHIDNYDDFNNSRIFSISKLKKKNKKNIVPNQEEYYNNYY